jgi:hypothetical protein
MTSVPSAVLTLLSIGALNWFALEARWAKPKAKEGYIEYSIPFGLKLVFSTVVPLLIYGALANIVDQHGEQWVSLLLVAIALFCAYFTPATILCSSERLISVKWYGIKKIAMNWSEVVSVYRDPQDDSIVVRDKLDRTIVHSMYNVGRVEFIEQITSLGYPFARMI